MKYNLKNINIDVDKGEKIEFPPLVDRTIEMHGQIVELTLSGIMQTQEKRVKRLKELNAQKAVEQAKIDNIESFHPFIKELSEKDIYTAWLYFEAKAMVKGCEDEIAKTEGYIKYDEGELEEIKKQIPELSDAAQEVHNMLNKDVK